jgi:hypothetical protein
VNIVGDISALGRLSPGPPATADPPPGGPAVPLEAAALAILGALAAGGAGGQSPEETVRDLDTRSLAKVLAKRSRRRLIKALPRLR